MPASICSFKPERVRALAQLATKFRKRDFDLLEDLFDFLFKIKPCAHALQVDKTLAEAGPDQRVHLRVVESLTGITQAHSALREGSRKLFYFLSLLQRLVHFWCRFESRIIPSANVLGRRQFHLLTLIRVVCVTFVFELVANRLFLVVLAKRQKLSLYALICEVASIAWQKHTLFHEAALGCV